MNKNGVIMLRSNLDYEDPQRTIQKFQWKQCSVCTTTVTFVNPEEFSKHLRKIHCTKEGGSFVCKYGYNGVCSSLPVEGVSDQDYEDHVARHHIFQRDDHVHIFGARNKSSRIGTAATGSTAQLTSSSFNEITIIQKHGEQNLYLSTQNLPAVLNDPGRGKEKDLFTKTWGDSFVELSEIPPCPFIPQITGRHFESYLRKIARKQKKRSRKHSGSRGASSDERNVPTRKNRNSLTADWREPEFEDIPKIFLQTDFSLQNVSTFNAVFPSLLGNVSETTSILPKSQPSARLLQEKLSHYLDIVEIQIARQVSLRSKAFFHAMTSHDALMEQLSNAISQVKMLRFKKTETLDMCRVVFSHKERVHTIDDILVKGSFRILKLKHRRQTYYTVYKKLKLIATVHQTQPAIQLLLSTSDFVGALDLIATTQEVLQQELSEIHSFRHLGSQLAELGKIIDKMIHSDFLRYATSDLTRPLTDVDVVMEEERLVAIVLGMLRLKKHSFINVYHEEAYNLVKAIVKQSVVESISNSETNDPDCTSLSLTDQVRLLGFDKWMELVNNVLNNLKKLLLRVKAVHNVMCDAVSSAAGKTNNPSSPLCKVHQNTENNDTELEEFTINEDDYIKLSNSLKEMLVAICDYADDRSAKLFSAKSKDGFFEKLSIAEFVILSKPVEDFVNACENICGKRSTNLQLALQSQAHRFISHFHEEKKTKLGLILDSERWVQADVPNKFQNLVDHICCSDHFSMPKDNFNDGFKSDDKPEDVLLVKGEKYKVIGTVLLLLNMIMEYCNCVEGLPYAAPEILTRLAELLKTFNSRSCQLVLGAGALQLVGLRTITTKNLALASRCLQLMAFFIPRIKIHFSKYLSVKQQNSIKHFDHTLKDYSDHIQEISNKMVNIIISMLDAQLNKWEVKPPVPSPCFTAICKHLDKLHEAIKGILPTDQVQKLFLRINTAFKNSLRRQLVKLNVTNDGGPQHGVVTSELEFYVQFLKSINCIRNEKDLGMEDIWTGR